jgi:hypothetical protein
LPTGFHRLISEKQAPPSSPTNDSSSNTSNVHIKRSPTAARATAKGQAAGGVKVEHYTSGAVDWVLDTRARLFLNLFMVSPRE